MPRRGRAAVDTAAGPREPSLVERPRATPDGKMMLLVAADFPDLGRQPRHDLEQITHDAVVRDLEDRRVLVPIDGDDGPGRAHAGEVLNGPGDAHRDVETRAHRLPGLPHLRAVIPPPRVDHRAA